MLDVFEEQLQKEALEVLPVDSQIIIVDDDPYFSFLIKDYLLSMCDFNAEHFANGEEFLSHYTSNDRRIIILDYDFGQSSTLNGLSILKQIRSINLNAIVIMVSSVDDLETALETFRNGASDYFLKSNKSVFANILSSLIKILQLNKHRLN